MNVIRFFSEVPNGSRGFIAVASASSSSQEPNPFGLELSSELACRVEHFLAANPVDVIAASGLRSSSPYVQLAVLKKGSLRWARNPSASLMWQLRKLACNEGAPTTALVHCPTAEVAAAAGLSGVDPAVIPAVPVTPELVDTSVAAAKCPNVGFVSMAMQQTPQSVAAETSTVSTSSDLGSIFRQESTGTRPLFGCSANHVVPCRSATWPALHGYHSSSERMMHLGTGTQLSPLTSSCSTLPAVEAGFLEVEQLNRAGAASCCTADNDHVSCTEDAGELWFCVEEFLLANEVDARAAAALRASPPHVKKAVLAGGSLGWASNCSAVLMSQLRKYSHSGDSCLTISNVSASTKSMHQRKLLSNVQQNHGLCPPVPSRRRRIRPRKPKAQGRSGEAAKAVSSRARRRVVYETKEKKTERRNEPARRRRKNEKTTKKEERQRRG